MTTAYPLYDPQMEHESCGVGAVIDLRAQATHRTVSDALTIVERLGAPRRQRRHGHDRRRRGHPHAPAARALCPLGAEAGVSPGRRGDYAVGMFFLPDDGIAAENICRIFDSLAAAEGMRALFWRDVPLPSRTAGRGGAAQHAPHPPVLPSPGRRTPPPGKRSTAASTSSAASLKSSRPAPTSVPSPAAPSSTRA